MKFLRVQCISISLSAAARIVTVLKQFSTPQFNAARARCFLFALQSIIAVLKLWTSMKKLFRQKTEREGGVLRIVTAILLAHISSNGAFGWECGRWHYLILIQFQTEKTPHTLYICITAGARTFLPRTELSFSLILLMCKKQRAEQLRRSIATLRTFLQSFYSEEFTTLTVLKVTKGPNIITSTPFSLSQEIHNLCRGAMHSNSQAVLAIIINLYLPMQKKKQ